VVVEESVSVAIVSDFVYGGDYCGTGLVSGNVKAIPLYACRGPEGSRSVRLPDFKTIGT
jgi:hypothetical protein